MDHGEYLAMFLDESRENVGRITEGLLRLEQDPTDRETVNDLFRAAHTLKGMSATMGFGRLAELTHELESALDPVRQGKTTLRPEDVDILFRATDRMEAMLRDIEGGGSGEAPIDDLVAALRSLGGGPQGSALAPPKGGETAAAGAPPSAGKTPAGALPDDYDVYHREIIRQALAEGLGVFRVEVVLRPDALLPGARAYVVYRALEALGEIVHSHPPVKELEEGQFDRSFVLTVVSAEPEAAVRRAVEGVADVETVAVTALNAASGATAHGAADQGAKEAAPGPSASTETPGATASVETYADYEPHHRSAIREALRQGRRAVRLEVVLVPGVLLKGARAYVVYQTAAGFGEVIHTAPPADRLEDGDFEDAFVLTLLTDADPETVACAVRGISEIRDVRAIELGAPPVQGAGPADGSAAGRAERSAAGQTQPPSAGQADPPAPSAPAAGRPTAGDRTAPAGRKAPAKVIRVDAERLDKLMNLFSELVIARGRLELIARELGHRDLADIVEHMSRTGSELQSLILAIRMVSVEHVFQRFPRMVRDVARELGKSVRLVIRGEETELDRTVVDEIGEPLVHLLRNAIDHGLESEAERKAAGKPPEGTIELVAYPSGNHVYIEVKDDGRGIDREKVLKKAIDRGLVRPEQAASMSDSAVFQLLFQPGFSTADVVTDLSGRGVGLDVVKSRIESLGGRVDVFSKRGAGTLFRLQLPLSLSILYAMLVDIGGETYALPIADLVETLGIPPEAVRTVHRQPVIDLRGAVVPLVDGRRFFRTDAPPFLADDGAVRRPEGEGGVLFVAVVKKNDRLAGLIVDRFLGQQEIVLKSLGAYLKAVRTFLGATILGDGRVALVVEPAAFFEPLALAEPAGSGR
ncbi:chemotaxis protein CheW [Hydrogenibacillus sp. N12]|uniref:chemotaxis protein CheW n=1 Tax=Hydrogenibacillus sp. N12 TaxID=2866627 RepID=UPI001C7DAB6D|nr:chemotaxis protein CheW [Hydrogenibacillus sp. N12]QZA33519.1 chemotaxis protein CheW [Hydrogenibacillus sp. N12]